MDGIQRCLQARAISRLRCCVSRFGNDLMFSIKSLLFDIYSSSSCILSSVTSFLRRPSVAASFLGHHAVRLPVRVRFSGLSCRKLLLWSSKLLLVAVFIFQPRSHHFVSNFRCCQMLLLYCFFMATTLPWRHYSHAAATPSQFIFISILCYSHNKCGDKSVAV